MGHLLFLYKSLKLTNGHWKKNALVYQWNVKLMGGRHERCHTLGKIELFQNPESLPALVNKSFSFSDRKRRIKCCRPLMLHISKLNGVPFASLQLLQCTVLSRYFGNFMQKYFWCRGHQTYWVHLLAHRKCGEGTFCVPSLPVLLRPS